MRSWQRALSRLKTDYPELDGVIEIRADVVNIRLSRDFNGKRAGIDRVVPTLQIEESAIDIVLKELAEAAGQLVLFPHHHVLQLRIIK